MEAEYGLKGNIRALDSLKHQETPWALNEYRHSSFITHCFFMLPDVYYQLRQGPPLQKGCDLLCCDNCFTVVAWNQTLPVLPYSAGAEPDCPPCPGTSVYDICELEDHNQLMPPFTSYLEDIYSKAYGVLNNKVGYHEIKKTQIIFREIGFLVVACILLK